MDRLLDATARAERDHFWFRGFRRFVRPLLEDATAGRDDLRVLDAGCGTGNNLALLSRYGRVTGVDLTFSGLTRARRAGRVVAQASVTHLPFPDATFDLLTSFDVIYALDDTAEPLAIREMARVLRAGGRMVLNVAALPALRGNHSILGGEVRRYTRAMLTDHLRRGGFEVRRITYTNASILPLVAAVRLLQRTTGHRASDREIRVPPAPVNTLLSAALALEALAVRVVQMPFGSSLLTLAVRSNGGTEENGGIETRMDADERGLPTQKDSVR